MRRWYTFDVPAPQARVQDEHKKSPFGNLPEHVEHHEELIRWAFLYLHLDRKEVRPQFLIERINEAIGISNVGNSALTVTTAFGMRCASVSIVRALEIEYLAWKVGCFSELEIRRMINQLKALDITDNHIFIKDQTLMGRYCTFFLLKEPKHKYAREVFHRYVLLKSVRLFYDLEFKYQFDCYQLIHAVVNAIDAKVVTPEIINLCIYLKPMNQDYLFIDADINPYVIFKAALDNDYFQGVCHNNVGFLFHYGVRKYLVDFDLQYNKSIRSDLLQHFDTTQYVNRDLKHHILNSYYVTKCVLFFIPLAQKKSRGKTWIKGSTSQAIFYYKKARMYNNINAINNVINVYLFKSRRRQHKSKQMDTLPNDTPLSTDRLPKSLTSASKYMVFKLFVAGLEENERNYIPVNFAQFLIDRFHFYRYSKIAALLMLGIEETNNPRSYRLLHSTLSVVTQSFLFKVFVPSHTKLDIQLSLLFNKSSEPDEDINLVDLNSP